MSVDAIRFYEKAGVLPPAQRDASGYRVYDESTLRLLVTVRWGRELGFPLEAMAAFVRTDPGQPGLRRGEISRLLAERVQAIDLEIERLQQKRAELGRLAAIPFDGSCRMPGAFVDELMEKHLSARDVGTQQAEDSVVEPAAVHELGLAGDALEVETEAMNHRK